MSDEQDPKRALEAVKKDMARKKKSRMTVPADFLDNAKSYEDKLTLVKVLTEREKQRVVLIFKKMIQAGIRESHAKKGLK